MFVMVVCLCLLLNVIVVVFRRFCFVVSNITVEMFVVVVIVDVVFMFLL